MRIKVKLFSTVKESDMANKRTNFNRFRAKSIILTTDSTSLNLEKGESETLKCLKSCIKDNGNTKLSGAFSKKFGNRWLQPSISGEWLTGKR